MKRQMWLAGVVTLVLAVPAAAQDRVVLLPESEVLIDGRSTVNTFTCRAGSVRGTGFLAGAGPLRNASQSDGVQADVRVRVPVTTFDCGQRRMNEDMYRALKAKAHPFIEYTLESAELVGNGAPGRTPIKLRARGRLTIAGTTRTVEVLLDGDRRADGRLQAAGQLPLRMTDFGIEPPTALLGLVKAHNDITVRFQLVAMPEVAQAQKN